MLVLMNVVVCSRANAVSRLLDKKYESALVVDKKKIAFLKFYDPYMNNKLSALYIINNNNNKIMKIRRRRMKERKEKKTSAVNTYNNTFTFHTQPATPHTHTHTHKHTHILTHARTYT